MKRKNTRKSASGKSRKREILGILFISFSLLLLVSLVTYDVSDWPNSSRQFGEPYHNKIGFIGAFLSHYMMTVLGYSSYSVLALLLIIGVVVFLHKKWTILVKPGFFLLVMGLFLPILTGLTADIGSDNTLAVPAFRFGGIFGGLLANFMVTNLGKTGAFLVSIAAVLITIVLTTNLKPSTLADWFIAIFKPFGALITGILPRPEKQREKTASEHPGIFTETEDDKEPIDESPFLTPVESEIPSEPSQPGREPRIVDFSTEVPTPEEELGEEEFPIEAEEYEEDYDREEYAVDRKYKGRLSEYILPGPELLDEPLNITPVETREEMLDRAQKIVDSLHHFGIDSEVRQITPGPVITRYELTLAPGVKVGRVVGLSDDLAMALRAKGGIRILAPIPGKAAIGIEVPNNTRKLVYLREVAESTAFLEAESPLVTALGKSTSGDPVVADLEKMPHLLIAGSTGSGKSICINTIIASILMKSTPDRVRMIMIDPKVVELSVYNTIPHLLTPVITDTKRAADSLKWAVREMENRYRQLASLGVRDISQYNARVKELAMNVVEDEAEEIPEPLPLIVIIIDEFADLMVIASNEIEEYIARLAQMARAVGIHLVIATQRPSADIITGLIKANFPSRIAFKVMQASNSRIILDQGGADKLLGLGDMLFLQVGKPEPIRLHGAFISNDECQRLVDYVASQSDEGPVEVNEEMFRSEEETENVLGLRDPNERDSLFFEAARLVVRHKQGSVSLLQRRLKIGYARAARLVDQLELAGIVTPYDGSKAREVLVDDAYIDDLESGNI